MPLPVWRGTTAITEAPDSPKFELTKDGQRIVRTFSGPYTAIAGALPVRLQALAGSPANFLVDTVTVEKAPGGRGVMTITICPSPVEDLDWPTGDGILEIEWIEVTKPLATHPRYQSGGAAALTDDDLDKIETWKNASNAGDRTAAAAGLSDNAKDFCKKLRRGTDSYVEYTPQARVTSKGHVKPTTGGCGKRSNPPSDLVISGYEYLKTADRATRRDRWWERVQEWTGAAAVDHDLYDAG